MAIDIRVESIACSKDNHGICEMPKCYCECHLPQEQQSVQWRARRLASSMLSDSERLQVLISLVAELADRR